MLSYQHGYHAGCYADVIKHLALTRLLSYLTIKDKPLFYLETHAGKGLYDLRDKQAQKTQEFQQGIALIWPEKNKLPPVFKNYLQAIEQLNPNKHLSYYPGSPALAIRGLRKIDRLYLCELHPRECEELETLPHEFKKVHVSNSDGIASLKALIPPPEKRGLIFVDPSFEIKDEYKTIPAALKEAFMRFSNGVFCLWYPVVDQKTSEKLIRRMDEIGAKNTLNIEFNLGLSGNPGMKGCGLYLINPPHTFAGELKIALETLKSYFNPGASSFKLRQSGN
jgi:23S rRNA (adenine2030-N6)-methyltransferase